MLVVHKKPNIHRNMTTPPADLALSGRPSADVHGVVNFAITEFSELRVILRQFLASSQVRPLHCATALGKRR